MTLFEGLFFLRKREPCFAVVFVFGFICASCYRSAKKKKRKTDKHLFLGLPLIKLYCYRCSFLTSKRFECVFSLYNYSLFKKTKKNKNKNS